MIGIVCILSFTVLHSETPMHFTLYCNEIWGTSYIPIYPLLSDPINMRSQYCYPSCLNVLLSRATLYMSTVLRATAILNLT